MSNWGPGHLNAFVLGSDGSVYNNPYFRNTTDPQAMWHNWTSTGNPGASGHPQNVLITSSPAAISRDINNKTLDVFATGSDKGIWRLCNPNGGATDWEPWTHVGNAGEVGHPKNINITSSPTVTSWNSKDLHVFARGSDNNIWYNYFTATAGCNGSWSGWNRTSSSPVGSNPTSLTRLDFETGDLSQWTKGPKVPTSQNNCAEYSDSTNRLDVVSSNTYPPGISKYSLQVTLTKNAITIPGTNGVRAELKYCDSPGHVHMFNDGSNQWYHWYTMFSPSFELPGSSVTSPWHVWTQWHTGNQGTFTYGVPVEFDLNKNILSLRVMSHYYDSIGCFNTTPPNCGYRWSEPLKQGIWYDVLVHIKWSTKSDGLVEGRIKQINGSTSVIQPYHGNTLNNLTTAPTDV